MADDTSQIPDSDIPVVNVAAPNVTVEPQITVQPAQINIPPSDNSEAKTANRYTLIGILVNTALFVITLAALMMTCHSVNVSEEAVQVSKNALQYSRENDSVARIQKQIDDQMQNSRYQEQFRQAEAKSRLDSVTVTLAQQSLRSQITAIELTQKQFQVETEENHNVHIVQIDVGTNSKDPVINFRLKDVSETPARILGTRSLYLLPPNFSYIDLGEPYQRQQMDMSKDLPVNELSVFLNVPDSILTRSEGFYVKTQFFYRNMVTGSIYCLESNTGCSYFNDPKQIYRNAKGFTFVCIPGQTFNRRATQKETKIVLQYAGDPMLPN